MDDGPAAVALDDVIVRQHGSAADIETCVARPARRSFPVHLSATFGLCVKTGPSHEVMADGRRLTYPADAVCVRAPGCVWESDAGHHGFVSLDLPAELVAGEGVRWDRFAMGFADPRTAPWARRRIRAVASAASRMEVEETVADLMVDLARAGMLTVPRSQAPDSRVVDRARDHLHEHLHLRPTLDETARAAGTDRFSLVRRFRSELGTTPHAYLVQARLTRAQQLLARGTAISEAAAVSGFADQAHLGRWFRRVYGITPSTYAAQVRPAIPFKTDPSGRWQPAGHDRPPAG